MIKDEDIINPYELTEEDIFNHFKSVVYFINSKEEYDLIINNSNDMNKYVETLIKIAKTRWENYGLSKGVINYLLFRVKKDGEGNYNPRHGEEELRSICRTVDKLMDEVCKNKKEKLKRIMIKHSDVVVLLRDNQKVPLYIRNTWNDCSLYVQTSGQYLDCYWSNYNDELEYKDNSNYDILAVFNKNGTPLLEFDGESTIKSIKDLLTFRGLNDEQISEIINKIK